MKKLVILTVLFFAVLANAKNQILLQQSQECFIGLHDNQVWQLPPWNGKGRVVVSFEQRLDFPRLGGWCPCWQISVNDKLLSVADKKHVNKIRHWQRIIGAGAAGKNERKFFTPILSFIGYSA